MGVIINTPDPFDDYIEDVLDNLLIENVQHQNEHRKPRKQKTRSPAKPTDCTKSGELKGNRRIRRLENATFLTSLAGTQDFGEVSIHDFVPESISAFAQVLMEQENINAWNNFVNFSEEEQDEFLQQMEQNSYSAENNVEMINKNDFFSDRREVHPAYDADLCFKKVESKFRNILKKRNFPLGILAHLEDEVTAFFLEWPQSVYTSLLPSGFDRLLLHILCQYLDLQSESFDRKGARHTRVKNPKDEFCLPTITLTSRLEKRLNGKVSH